MLVLRDVRKVGKFSTILGKLVYILPRTLCRFNDKRLTSHLRTSFSNACSVIYKIEALREWIEGFESSFKQLHMAN